LGWQDFICPLAVLVCLQDPEGFIQDGGWSFLDAEQSDSEDEGDEEESDFAPRWAMHPSNA
jgi:nucleosome binding factor SPN SPT16 subunit